MKNISPNTKQEIVEKIQAWKKKKSYLRSDYSLNAFCGEIGYNYKYLSFIINQEFNCDFPTFINNLRFLNMIEIVDALEENQFYKLEAVAKASGFSTYAKFAHFIRTNMGLSPKDYFLIRQKKTKFLISLGSLP
ncbi:helix-turn-helix domain-containing protein [Sphingobacterium cellulitidis]|uniref:helix-turn-helix domain-containing protein n=1 Tax=Sphingobacterium cellulitidis TaxID=1768011 RepID=UPI000B940AB1|nr:hypothetical protein CHT99_11920 [Sphingobacterium cellulitidis]